MKKLIILALFLSSSSLIFAQELEKKKFDFSRNELKINALYLVLGAFEVSYESLLDEESGIGVSLTLPISDEISDLNFMITPYYRFYFGNKPAAGFFMEGFASVNSTNRFVYNNNNFFSGGVQQNVVDTALGIGLGGKWITKKGVVFETNWGLGRNIFNNTKGGYDGGYFIPRFGISVGYRF